MVITLRARTAAHRRSVPPHTASYPRREIACTHAIPTARSFEACSLVNYKCMRFLNPCSSAAKQAALARKTFAETRTPRRVNAV